MLIEEKVVNFLRQLRGTSGKDEGINDGRDDITRLMI